MTMGSKAASPLGGDPAGARTYGAVIYGQGGFGAGQEQISGDAWMVTFTDLVALMLTFFVLLFSMSRVDEVQWQNLKDSFALGLDRVSEFKVPMPEEELDIKRVTALPGDDLGYLASVLQQHIADIPALSESLVENQGDQLRLALWVDRLFEPSGESLTVEGDAVLFAIGGFVSSLANGIEVAGYVAPPKTGPTEREKAWGAALARAQSVASRLTSAGYRRDISVRALGVASRAGGVQDASSKGVANLAGRVDIIIRANSGEAF